MNKLVALVFLATAVVFASCGDKNKGEEDVNLVFQANFGNEVLEFAKNYELVDGKTFNLSRSDVFLSDVRLVADDGTELPLFDYIQVDFADSPGGVRFVANDIPEQNYEMIKFGVGLNAEQNMTKPIDYPADDVLNSSGHYWIGWNSYIFSKTEGKVDEDGDGVLETGWIFHTGTDELKREVSLVIDRELGDREDEELRIVIEHQGLFVKDGEAVGLGITHDPSDLEVLGTFVDRLVAGISIK